MRLVSGKILTKHINRQKFQLIINNFFEANSPAHQLPGCSDPIDTKIPPPCSREHELVISKHYHHSSKHNWSYSAEQIESNYNQHSSLEQQSLGQKFNRVAWPRAPPALRDQQPNPSRTSSTHQMNLHRTSTTQSTINFPRYIDYLKAETTNSTELLGNPIARPPSTHLTRPP